MSKDGPERRVRRTPARRRAATGAAIFAVLAIIGLGIVYGPLLVSGNYHRAAIERLASNAVGRPVRIAGPIMLSLLPDPQLRAENVTIGGPQGTRITAATLKLDLELVPLLLGRLRGSRLTLNRPDIILPWPLPGGVSAIAPPPWLASLHARINDGTLRLGPLHIDHADLAIFTGGPHTVITASGTARFGGIAAAVTLDLADAGSFGPAPVTASLKFKTEGTARFDFRGTLDHASVLAGRLTGTLDHKAATSLAPKGTTIDAATATGELTATGKLVAWRDVTIASGRRRFAGDATLVLAPAPLLRLEGQGSGLVLDRMVDALAKTRQTLPVVASIDLAQTTVGKLAIPKARVVLLADDQNVRVQALDAMLPGGAKLSFAGSLAAPLHGTFSLDAPDPRATLTALQASQPYLPVLPDGFGPLKVDGKIAMLKSGTISLAGLHGRFTARAHRSAFTGELRISPADDRSNIAAHLDFEHLTIDTRALSALHAALSTDKPRLAGQINVTANRFLWLADTDHGTDDRLDARNLLIDAELHRTGGVSVRLASLNMGHGLLSGHGSWTDRGRIGSASVSFTGPDAHTAFNALSRALGIATGWTNPPAFHERFAISLTATGPVAALRAAITLHLGDLRAVMTPTIDLKTGNATGTLALRAPNAVALIRRFGGASALGARNGLGWPGPGSASLRTSVFIANNRIGLSNFTVSLGTLTATGRLNLDLSGQTPVISGRIAADTLAIPTPASLVELAHAALGSRFRIDLPHVTANRIDRAGITVATDAAFSLSLRHDHLAPSITLGLDRITIDGGTLRGSVVLTAPAATAPPTLSLNSNLTGADATDIAAASGNFGIPLPFARGTLGLSTKLTATGSDIPTWRSTLSGSLTGSGKNLTLAGIDLGQAGTALAAATVADHPATAIATTTALRTALRSGSTDFDLLDLTATLGHGIVTLDHASLTGPHGTLAASGKADIERGHLDLAITAHPALSNHPKSPAISIALTGAIRHPAVRTDIAPAIVWVTSHKMKPPSQPTKAQTAPSSAK